MGRRVVSEDVLRAGTLVPRWLRLLPLAILLLTVLLQVASPDPMHAGFATAIVPLLGAFVLGPFWTGVLAVVATLVIVVPLPRTVSFDGADVLAVAAVCVTAVGIAQVRQRATARLVTVASVAEAAQLAILPGLPDRVGDLECAGVYHSAQRGASVGGDMFDLRESPFGTRMILGDVQGHGLDAVSTASTLLGAFHEAILDEPDLEGVAARLERRIVIDADQGHIPELFASVLLAEFGPDAEHLRMLSCGHPPPLMLRADRIEELDLSPSPVLGLRLETDHKPNAVTVPFGPEEMLLAYSDGLSEARDLDGRYYPLARQLHGLVVPPAPRLLVDFVWEDLTRFAVKLDDDVSLLAITRAGRARTRPALD